MSADIEKLAVFDARIVQSRPKYAVEKGALSLTNAPFTAIAQTSSQHTYNIYVPSENVFVDRKLQWSSTCFQSFTAQLAAQAPGDSIVVPGRDFALTAFPLNSLCSTLSSTINDTTAVINTQDVLKEVLRLTDYKANKLVRTTPTMLDKYASYNDAYGTLNNPLGGYDQSTDYDNVPNGSYPNLVFTAANGQQLPNAPVGGVYKPAFAGANYSCAFGVPTTASAWAGATVYAAGDLVQNADVLWLAVAPVVGVAPAAPAWTNSGPAIGPYTIYIKWRSTEPIVLSPYVFADTHEWDTGLFGINNIQLIMNFVSSPNRIIRSTTRAGRTISNVAFSSGVPNPFTNSIVNVQFLTPSLDVPLPPKSVVPYMEFPRYISIPSTGTIEPGQTAQIQSQTITLPQIPDMLIIYAKPSVYSQTDGDYYFPVATRDENGNTVAAPLTLNFDNFSGLLSSMTAEQLYDMSVHNGLNMDYASWLGQGHSAAGTYPGRQQGQIVPLVGGILCLKPGQDITLQAGQAPSLVGNFTLQFNLTVKNTQAVALQPTLYVITVNSGFFETIRGSSRIIKGVLSEQDIISAPLASDITRDAMKRHVGGFSFGSLANILSKAKDIYERTKPVVSAVRGMMPEDGMMGKVKGALGAVGYGTSGGGTGGARSGGLARRLM